MSIPFLGNPAINASPYPLPKRGSVEWQILFQRTVRLLALCVFACCASNVLAMQDYERIRPKEPEKSKPRVEDLPVQEPDNPDDQRVLLKELRGICFVGKPEDVVKEALDGEGLKTESVERLNCDEFRKQIEPFLGHAVSRKSINEIAKLTIRYYRSKDRPFVNVGS